MDVKRIQANTGMISVMGPCIVRQQSSLPDDPQQGEHCTSLG